MNTKSKTSNPKPKTLDHDTKYQIFASNPES